MRLSIILALLAGGIITSALARGADAPPPVPKVFQDVIDCRQITEAQQRLGCYDDSVSRLQTAQQTNELRVADKQQVAETNRGLFGLNLPGIKIFGGGKDDEVNAITSEIASVSRGSDGWILEIEDGALWAQTDGAPLGRSPKVGDAIEVKKAALGSYKAKVANGVAFRVKRLNK